MVYDVIVLGCGPAGLAAAVAARGRNKRVLVVGNRWEDSPLARAERVDNYLGLPGKTGAEMLAIFYDHAREMGVDHETLLRAMVVSDLITVSEDRNRHAERLLRRHQCRLQCRLRHLLPERRPVL